MVSTVFHIIIIKLFFFLIPPFLLSECFLVFPRSIPDPSFVSLSYFDSNPFPSFLPPAFIPNFDFQCLNGSWKLEYSQPDEFFKVYGSGQCSGHFNFILTSSTVADFELNEFPYFNVSQSTSKCRSGSASTEQNEDKEKENTDMEADLSEINHEKKEKNKENNIRSNPKSGQKQTQKLTELQTKSKASEEKEELEKNPCANTRRKPKFKSTGYFILDSDYHSLIHVHFDSVFLPSFQVVIHRTSSDSFMKWILFSSFVPYVGAAHYTSHVGPLHLITKLDYQLSPNDKAVIKEAVSTLDILPFPFIFINHSNCVYEEKQKQKQEQQQLINDEEIKTR